MSQVPGFFLVKGPYRTYRELDRIFSYLMLEIRKWELTNGTHNLNYKKGGPGKTLGTERDFVKKREMI